SGAARRAKAVRPRVDVRRHRAHRRGRAGRSAAAGVEARGSVPSRRRIPFALPPAALLLVLLALPGCGGDDEPARSAVATVTQTATAPATTGATTPPPSPVPDPNASMTLREAQALLDEKGYATLTARDWRPDQPLKVLLGIERSRDRPR